MATNTPANMVSWKWEWYELYAEPRTRYSSSSPELICRRAESIASDGRIPDQLDTDSFVTCGFELNDLALVAELTVLSELNTNKT
jgi:hypothetical protein